MNIYRIDVTKIKASGLTTAFTVESFPGDRHGPSALYQILAVRGPYE